MSGDEVCLVNLGPREVRRRLLPGLVLLGLGLASGAVAVTQGWASPLRYVPAVLLGLGTLNVLQARTKTCVVLGLSGRRNLDAGDEDLTDAAVARALRARSWRLIGLAVLASGAAAAALALAPA